MAILGRSGLSRHNLDLEIATMTEDKIPLAAPGMARSISKGWHFLVDLPTIMRLLT
jgi:hypothetical protein